MKVTPHSVTNSNIHQVGHQNADLFIAFHSGGTYRYDGVPESFLDEMLAAESVGKFFHARIKGQFPYTKLSDNPFELHQEE